MFCQLGLQNKGNNETCARSNMSVQCQNSNDRYAQIRYACGGFRSNSVTSVMAIVLILLMVCDVFSLSKNLMSNHGLLAVHLFKRMM